MASITAVSLFSGCGGFDLGVKNCAVDIIWANDIDSHAASAYKSLFPDVEFVHKDIQEISAIPSADILIGCYPCTGFSEASRRRAKNQRRRDLRKNPTNFLFQELLKSIKIVQPKFIFIENVRGMLSASKGYFMNEQIQGIQSLGYTNVQFRLLNAEHFGVPQSRKRIFIVGIHNSVQDFNYSFPQETHGFDKPNPIKNQMDVLTGMPQWPKGEYSKTDFHGHYLTRNRKRSWDLPSYTIVANADHVPLHPMGDPMEKVGTDRWILKGEANRRLSWRECARLQGLPDNIEIEGSLSAKYKVIGNSVPPILAEAVAKPAVQLLTQ
ncbi:MAG: DNA cytosine methyltransferase [Candidatus Kapaibacterium sp.]